MAMEMEMEMEMERERRSSRKDHVLVFPFPGQGHLIPMLDLAYILASRGIAVTVLTTSNPENQSLFITASSQGLHIQPLFLPLPPTQGLPCENIAQLPLHLIPLFIYSFKQLADPLEQWLLEQRSCSSSSDGFGPPLCIISDFFLGWTQETAAKLGIPRVVFYPSGAFAMCISSSVWKHMPHLGVESDEGEVHIPELPHPLCLPKYKISSLARAYKPSDPVSEFIKHEMNLNRKSWGSVINSFDGLEALYIDHLERVSGRPLWSVGPLLPPTNNNLERGNPNAIKESVCLQWLDSRKRKSVVYICFGNLAVLSNRQMEEVAAGLEASEESFIWVIKDPPYSRLSHEYGGVLPQGFEEITKDRGLVIRGWAPQLLILSHSSVGGFLTHCGWNSVVETIAFGVPLIAWPMGADQYYNALLLVDYLQAGIRLCEGGAAMPSRDDLKSAVKRVLSPHGEETKRAEELSNAATMAVQPEGSSSKNLEAFVSQIKGLLISDSRDRNAVTNHPRRP